MSIYVEMTPIPFDPVVVFYGAWRQGCDMRSKVQEVSDCTLKALSETQTINCSE